MTPANEDERGANQNGRKAGINLEAMNPGNKKPISENA
jgi:hypothetical protein